MGLKIVLSEEKLKEIMENGTPKDLEKYLEFEMGRAFFGCPEEIPEEQIVDYTDPKVIDKTVALIKRFTGGKT